MFEEPQTTDVDEYVAAVVARRAVELEEKKEKKREVKRRWRIENPDKVRGHKKQAYAANPEKAKQASREWARKNPDKVRAIQQLFYFNNKDSIAAKAKLWKAENPEKVRMGERERHLKKKYGLSIAERDALVTSQGGCKICGTLEPDPRRGNRGTGWNVDHCHNTGRVRGILCGPCNRGLGQFKDNPENLRAAADYLEQN